MDPRLQLKRFIVEHSIKQNAIAKKAGISPSAFSQTLNGNRRLYADELINICQALSITPDDLNRMPEA